MFFREDKHAHISSQQNELKQYVLSQLNTFFPSPPVFSDMLDSAVDMALQRLEHCFSHISDPAFCENGIAKFNHLHSDQYAQFLWFLANSLWKLSQNQPLCDKLVCLNKALNAVLITYKVALPDIFLLGHPVGTVLGNAEYHDFLVVLQNVTVEQATPLSIIGRGVFLGAGAKIIQHSRLGDHCSVGANTVLHKAVLLPGDIAFTAADGLKIAAGKKVCAAQKYFNCKIE